MKKSIAYPFPRPLFEAQTANTKKISSPESKAQQADDRGSDHR